MSNEAGSREIADALIAIEGVRFLPAAPITFKSGIKSPVYCDNRRFPFWPEQWAKVIRGFEDLIAERMIRVDVLAGVESAGIPHSAALGFSMRLPSVFIRKILKEHGTRKRVEGGDVTGRRVVLIEDLVTTGGSSIAAIEALRAEGAVVSDCLAIISYDFPEAVKLFEKAGIQLRTATTFQAVLENALEHKLIDEAGASVVRDWLHEPHSWAKRNGFE